MRRRRWGRLRRRAGGVTAAGVTGAVLLAGAPNNRFDSWSLPSTISTLSNALPLARRSALRPSWKSLRSFCGTSGFSVVTVMFPSTTEAFTVTPIGPHPAEMLTEPSGPGSKVSSGGMSGISGPLGLGSQSSFPFPSSHGVDLAAGEVDERRRKSLRQLGTRFRHDPLPEWRGASIWNGSRGCPLWPLSLFGTLCARWTAPSPEALIKTLTARLDSDDEATFGVSGGFGCPAAGAHGVRRGTALSVRLGAATRCSPH